MAVRKVNITEYECDCCGKRQYGKFGEDVNGLVGSTSVSESGGGAISIEWFACDWPCVQAAVETAIRRAQEGNPSR